MGTQPVTDWIRDYDVFDDGYVRNPFAYWPEMRTECPVVTSERWGGSHLVLGYEAVVEGAANTAVLTSTLGTAIAPTLDNYTDPQRPQSIINSDPPNHAGPRRLILPSMSPMLYQPCATFCPALAQATASPIRKTFTSFSRALSNWRASRKAL